MKSGISMLIWGAGMWARELLSELPDCCFVEALVETKKTKNSFLGHRVISKAEFTDAFAQVDYVIIAVEKYKEILDTIIELEGSDDRVFVEQKDSNNNIYFTNKGFYWGKDELFDIKHVLNLLISYNNPYAVMNCQDLRFMVNSEYKIMLKDMSFGSTYQQEDMALFVELLNKYYPYEESKDIFLDVGANIGTSSIWLNKHFFKNYKIIAFEPVPDNCVQFKCNCLLNGISEDNYVLVQGALSDCEGEGKCYLANDGNMGDNRISIEDVDDRDYIYVKKYTLDKWLKNNNYDANRIKFIWMDAQAHEPFVLKGGIETLKNNNIGLYMEFWTKELIRNNTLDILIEELEGIYKSFICIQKFRGGDEAVYPITYLKEFAIENINFGYDLFMIK